MSTPWLNVNPLKRSLRAGRRAVGCMLVEIRQTAVMRLLANAGLDFVIIDNEHGPFTIETIADLSREAVLLGITPIVRVPDLSYASVTRPLDAGALGIMIPRVRERHEVEEVVRMAKYPPAGIRGSVMARGHTNFLGGPVGPAMGAMNEETMVVVQIETREAFERVDSILSVPGVDVGFIGPNDLSIALGMPGEMERPEFVRALETIRDACRAGGVAPAIQMNDVIRASHWAARGMQMLSFSSEAGMLTQAARDARAAIDAAAEHAAGQGPGRPARGLS